MKYNFCFIYYTSDLIKKNKFCLKYVSVKILSDLFRSSVLNSVLLGFLGSEFAVIRVCVWLVLDIFPFYFLIIRIPKNAVKHVYTLHRTLHQLNVPMDLTEWVSGHRLGIVIFWITIISPVITCVDDSFDVREKASVHLLLFSLEFKTEVWNLKNPK